MYAIKSFLSSQNCVIESKIKLHKKGRGGVTFDMTSLRTIIKQKSIKFLN